MDSQHEIELPLSEGERMAYAICKSQIRQGFLQVAQALMEVRDNCLYREEYGSFDEFCRVELKNPNRNSADKIISAYRTHQVLESAGVEILPDNQSQIRPITKYSPDEQVELWSIACALAGGTPTHRLMRRVAQSKDAVPRGTYEPGQSVSVQDTESPYHGKTGTVTRTNGVILYADIEGEEVALLSAEVQESTHKPATRPVQSSPLIEAQLSVAQIRLQQMEAILDRVLKVACRVLPTDLVDEIKRLIQ